MEGGSMKTQIKYHFEIPDHDCNDYGFCSLEEGYLKNTHLMEKQPKFVPYKYYLQGDWKDWVKFYEGYILPKYKGKDSWTETGLNLN